MKTAWLAAGAATWGVASGISASAQSVPEKPNAAPSAYVTIVKVPKPWYAPQALVKRKMLETVSQYERIPGLIFKAYSFAQADGHFGGIYLWTDRRSAEQWFNPAWFERVKKERGVAGEVRFLEAPVLLENAVALKAALAGDQAVATLVMQARSASANSQSLVDSFKADLAQDRSIPGLLRKYGVLLGDGQFGAVYLWANQAQAKEWLSPAWQARMQQRHGSPVNIEWFDAPILLRTQMPDNAVAKAIQSTP
jgi:hypothetical protein